MKSLSLNQMANVEGGQSAATRRKLCNYYIRLASYALSIGDLPLYWSAVDLQWVYCLGGESTTPT
jgi:hypothetical protein